MISFFKLKFQSNLRVTSQVATVNFITKNIYC